MKIIDKEIHQAHNRKQSPHTVDIPKISLPYIKGTIDRIAKILRKQDIPVPFTPPNTIGKMVESTKDQVDLRNQKGVYIIPFSCGKVYIGETGRSINIHLKEHVLDITRDRANKSSLTKHSHNSSHHICIENDKLLTKEENHLERWVKEDVEFDK